MRPISGMVLPNSLETFAYWVRGKLGSLVVWQWDDKQNQAVARMDTVHSCRDFVKIQDWARAHQWVDRFDNYVHVEDDIEIPVF